MRNTRRLGKATFVTTLLALGALESSGCSGSRTSDSFEGVENKTGAATGGADGETRIDFGASGSQASPSAGGRCDPNNTLQSSDVACNRCIQTNCGRQNQTCAAHCGCQALTMCLLTCRGSQSCITGCQKEVPAETVQLFVALETCLGTCVGDRSDGPCGNQPSDAGGG